MRLVWAVRLDDGDYDLRQWVSLRSARLIYEARRGLSDEVQHHGGDPARLISTIWQVAREERRYGMEPAWQWVWRAPA